MRRFLFIVLGFYPASACVPTPAMAAEFHRLGDLPGGNFYSRAEDVSADGLTVVGYSQSIAGNEVEAFRWTQVEGMTDLGDAGEPSSRAHAVSADGSFIVGERGPAVSSGDSQPAVWKVNDEVTLIPVSGYHMQRATRATGVSADGSVVVGEMREVGPWTLSGFRWSPEGLFFLSSIHYGWDAYPAAVSPDGQTVVGGSWTGAPGEGDWWEATRWDAWTVIAGEGDNQGQGLGRLGSTHSAAFAISADGSTIVGESGAEAVTFCRPGTGGIVGLDRLTGHQASSANDVSGDGGVIVGWSEGPGPLGKQAFIWDEAHEMRSLQEVLETDFGLDLSDWALRSAEGISDDGTVICGWGTNPSGQIEAWVAIIPEPSTLALLTTGALALLTYAWRRRRRC